ncbi:MAG: hypothetical protein HQK58_04595 [Deltaproteobacteria bacterium]|nr:hypothetical protein [Deltaproteobacteria bacterium]
MKFSKIKTYLMIGVCFLLTIQLLACGVLIDDNQMAPPPPPVPRFKLNKVAVLPFEIPFQADNPPRTARCPISGTLFTPGPVKPGQAVVMSNSLMSRLAGRTAYQIIPPEHVEGIKAGIMSYEAKTSPLVLVQEVGKALNADAVLVCYLFRFQERVGTTLAAESPASVAFILNMVRTSNGEIIWQRVFDETQQSLSENVLNLQAFFQRGVKWLTAEELAQAGLDHTLKNLPQ